MRKCQAMAGGPPCAICSAKSSTGVRLAGADERGGGSKMTTSNKSNGASRELEPLFDSLMSFVSSPFRCSFGGPFDSTHSAPSICMSPVLVAHSGRTRARNLKRNQELDETSREAQSARSMSLFRSRSSWTRYRDRVRPQRLTTIILPAERTTIRQRNADTNRPF